MEILDDTKLYESSLRINQSIKVALDSITKWAKFISIVGYIGLAAMVMAGLAIILSSCSSNYGASPVLAVGLVYVVMAALYFFPVHSLFKFAINMRTALRSDNQDKFNAGFINLASNFKFVGKMTIVILSIYGLIFIFGILERAIN